MTLEFLHGEALGSNLLATRGWRMAECAGLGQGGSSGVADTLLLESTCHWGDLGIVLFMIMGKSTWSRQIHDVDS